MSILEYSPQGLIYIAGIVPVVKINQVENAVPLCQALLNGGLSVAEITFRTACAADAISAVRNELPQMLVGAGTITSIDQAKQALEAGACFLVSPGFNPDVVDWALDNEIPIYPGCTTASEVEQALHCGLDVVKFFPAEQSGGLDKIKALCGPYPQMRFMPTGGINIKNMANYLASPHILACGGSFMVPDALIKNEAWSEISSLTQEAVCAAHGFELSHVGIYNDGAEAAAETAQNLACLTGLAIEKNNSSVFVGSGVELMNTSSPYKGHLAYSVLNVDRSIKYLAARGFEIDENSIKYDNNNMISFAYLKQSFSGFALHLSRK